VLQGAAMPAVLIEVGYLTNPAEEKKLRDDRFMMDLAKQIRKGIEDFFSQEQP
jgi:N-acetylmuramoyl-L-alanine amidase